MGSTTTRSNPSNPPEFGADPGQFYGRRRRMAATLDAMRRRYSAARAVHPRKINATFQAPVDLPEERFAALRLQKVKAFLDAYGKQGWRAVIDARHPIQIRRGACPAFDLREGKYVEGVREYVVSAWFVLPDAKPLRIELPDWFDLPATAADRHGDPRRD